MRTRTVSALLLLASCQFSLDRALGPGELRGTVVFQSTGSQNVAAAGAHVVLENSAISVSADAQGRFVISNLAPNTYAVSITASQSGNGKIDSGLRLQGITLQPGGANGLADGRDLGILTVGAFGAMQGTVVNGTAPVMGGTAVVSGIASAQVSQGAYTIPSLIPGDYDLGVFAPLAMGTAAVSASVLVHVSPRTTTMVPPIDLSQGTMLSSSNPASSISGQAQLAGAGGNSQGISITLASPEAVTAQLPTGISTSDTSGDYSVTEIPGGVYTITANVGGYESVSVSSILVGSSTATVPLITLTPLSSAGADGGTGGVAAACAAEVACAAPAPIFPFAPDCNPTVSTVLSGLTAAAQCAASAAALDALADCVATAPCEAFGEPGGVCGVPAGAFVSTVSATPSCEQIASVLLGSLADAGMDGGPGDAGSGDAGSQDSGPPDAGSADAGSSDAGSSDAGSLDAGSPDAGIADAGVIDGGRSDAGTTDAGEPDAGPSDAGSQDAGSTDAGPGDAGGIGDAGYCVPPVASSQVWVSTLAGNGLIGSNSLGQTVDGTGGPSGTAQVSPQAIAVDGVGNVAIAETYNAVRRVDPCGNVTTLVVMAEENGVQLIDSPLGVAFDNSGNIWVASADDAIVEITGAEAWTDRANGGGISSESFQWPGGIVLDGSGNAWFTDVTTQAIWELPAGASTAVLFAGANPATTSSFEAAGFTDAQGTSARFDRPIAIARDSAGNLYVADEYNEAIREIDTSGNVTTVAGTGQSGFADGSGTRTGTARFNYPTGIAVDPQGNIFVADSINQAIRWITPAGTVSTIVRSAGAFLDGPAGTAGFGSPGGLAIDANENIYFGDASNGRLRVVHLPAGYLAAGQQEPVDGGPGTAGPAPTTGSGVTSTPVANSEGLGLAFDGVGDVYDDDPNFNAILEATPDGGTAVLAGTQGRNSRWGFVNGQGSAAEFFQPWGLVRDSTGNLIVADSENNVLRKVDPSNNVTTLAGTGTAGFLDGPAASALLYSPRSLAIDGNDNVYIADSQNNRIRLYTASSKTLSTIAGNGAPGYQDGAAAAAEFLHPSGVALDSSGDVFVADTGNSRIREISASGMVTTLAGNGQTGYVDGTGGAAGAAEFNLPTGVAVASTGIVYVADPINTALRMIGSNGTVSTFIVTTPVSLSGLDFGPSWSVTLDALGNVYAGGPAEWVELGCAGVMCSGVCVDTNDDPLNCGGCGGTCPGALPACNAGSCREVSVAASLYDATTEQNTTLLQTPFVVADETLYWGGGGNLISDALDGGTPQTLSAFAETIASDQNNVYLGNGSELFEYSLDGGFVSTLSDSLPGALGVDAIAAGQSNVYFTDGSVIGAIPIVGGSAITFETVPSENGFAMAADENNVYWANTVGTSTALIAAAQSTGVVSTLAPMLPWPYVGTIATDGTRVYATMNTSNTSDPGTALVAVSVGGGSPSTLSGGAYIPGAMAVDGTNVYWIDRTDDTILKVSCLGGTTYTLISARLDPGSISYDPSDLTLDSNNVYWFNGYSPGILSVPK